MRSETSVTRLTIDLPSDMHRLIKMQASLNDLSIKDFIIETIGQRFDVKKPAKKDKISKNQMNAKTIAVIRDSIKNHDKLKRFKNVDEMMEYLNTPEKPSTKKAKLKTPKK